MQKPEIKLENGMLLVKAQHSMDMDKDGKPSAEIELMLKLHPAEVVSEIAKKDMPMLEALLAQLKANG